MSTTAWAARWKKSDDVAALCSTSIVARNQLKSGATATASWTSSVGKREAATSTWPGGGPAGRLRSDSSRRSAPCRRTVLRPTARTAGSGSSHERPEASSPPSPSRIGTLAERFVRRTRPSASGSSRTWRRDMVSSSSRAITARQVPPSSGRLE